MKVKFYGVRGSIPVCEKSCQEVGGNSSCVLLTLSNDRILILDAGTGIRKLGNDLIKSSHEQFDNIFIVFSHTHWDHIQGFPFFRPAYDPRRHFTLVSFGKDKHIKNLEDIFAIQMQEDFFPVPLNEMGASFTFYQPEVYSQQTEVGYVKVSKHNHPGDSYGYRFESDGKILVYCTDVEHVGGIDQSVVALAQDADLLIHDAQYTAEELKEKKGWGHSSWEEAVEVAKQAGVKRLALFHHDPEHTDAFLFAMEMECKRRFPNVFLAKEGDEIKL